MEDEEGHHRTHEELRALGVEQEVVPELQPLTPAERGRYPRGQDCASGTSEKSGPPQRKLGGPEAEIYLGGGWRTRLLPSVTSLFVGRR